MNRRTKVYISCEEKFILVYQRVCTFGQYKINMKIDVLDLCPDY